MNRETTRTYSIWQVNQCFELVIPSPYQNAEEYRPFTTESPPSCQPITSGVQIDCTVKNNGALKFALTSLDAFAESQKSISFTISNFQTPYSSLYLSGIVLRSYGDSECLRTRRDTFAMQSLDIRPAFMPNSAVSVTNSVKQIGSTDPKNTLYFSFKPQTTMDPSGTGKIQIGIPLWFSDRNLINYKYMYNENAVDQCQSTCMIIESSIPQGQHINIRYSQMLPGCTSGDAEIVIECMGFYSPIYQDKWYGFFVNTFDSNNRLIEQSSRQIFLDTTSYEPFVFPRQNFLVDPVNRTVNTESEWDFTLLSTIPFAEECYIELRIPSDIDFTIDLIEAEGIFKPKNLDSILYSQDVILEEGSTQDPRRSITIVGCYDESYLGLIYQSFSTMRISRLTSQRSRRDSGPFDLTIYKNEEKTQLIAVLAQGSYIPGSSLDAGSLTRMQMYPLVYQTQVSSLLYLNFTTSHDVYKGTKIVIDMPQHVVLPPQGAEVVIVGLQSATSGSQKSVDAQYANVLENRRIEILDFVTSDDRNAPFQFVFGINGIQNQISAKDAGEYTITTYEKWRDNFYMIDQLTSQTSFVAEPGLITTTGQVTIDYPTNYRDNSTYTLKFTSPGSIPQNGFIRVRLPPEIQVVNEITLKLGSCRTFNCVFISQDVIQFQLTQSTKKNQEISLLIGGVKNPRTFQPTSSFFVETYDINGISLIDSGFNLNTQTTNAGNVTLFYLQRSNETNGARTNYTFAIKTSIPIFATDVLKFKMPAQVQMNADGTATQCISSDQITCGIAGQEVTIQIISLADQFGFSWTMTNVANPPSMKPSDIFSEIFIMSQSGYLVSNYQGSLDSTKIVNKQPAKLQQHSLFQESLIDRENTTYTLSFTPVNALPSTASIVIKYPIQVEMSNGNQTSCFVTTTKLWNNSCSINTASRTVTIKGAFSQSTKYSSQITIVIANMTNPQDNRPGLLGFDVTTYEDSQQLYPVDKGVNIMTPILKCDYPCNTCDANDRTNCSSCWLHDFQLPNYLMSSVFTGKGRCMDRCDFGYTSSGSPRKVCQKCDESCDGCKDDGLFDDSRQCLTCSQKYPFRLNATNLCLAQCSAGIFQMEELTCGTCNSPCQSCYGTADNCTSCIQNSTLPDLYQGKCIEKCPEGFMSVGGFCTQCVSPCKSCSISPTICDTCDKSNVGNGPRNIQFSGTCYAECPPGYSTDYERGACIGCQPGCDNCNLRNTSQCLRCAPQLVLFDDTCFAGCPDGYKVRYGVCMLPSAWDMVVMYFPFLIAAAVLIIIVLASKLKKRYELIDGIPVPVNKQQSIVSINAFVAPLQTLAVILLLSLSYYEGHKALFAMALAVFIAMILFNWAFLFWFFMGFMREIVYKKNNFVVKNKNLILAQDYRRETVSQAEVEFAAFFCKHKVSTLCVLAMTGGCHFNMFKLLYSRFFMFDMFKAKFTKATHLRETLVKWQIAYIVSVHCVLLIVCLYGIIDLTFSVSQLSIVIVEVAILTLLIMCLQILELIFLQEIFMYTEQKMLVEKPKDMYRFKKRVQNQKQTKKKKQRRGFETKKIFELLEEFGGRKCKSFEDQQFQEKIEDDRALKSWDFITPPSEPPFYNFSMNDAYQRYDNVYADGIERPRVVDCNIQAGEPGRREFHDALMRKQNELLSESQLDLSEQDLFLMKTSRLRGRQNKYYNAIEIEDAVKVDQVDQDQTYRMLIQQEEVNEDLQKTLVPPEEQELANQRKLKRNQEKAKQREIELLKAQQLKAEQEAEVQRLKQIEEEKRIMKEEQARQKLLLEAEKIRIQKEKEESEKAKREIQESFERRKREEEQERERLKAEQIEKERQERIREEHERERVERERIQREIEAEMIRKQKEDEDRKRIEQVRLLQQQQEMLRQQEKERKLREDQMLREQQMQKEAEERQRQLELQQQQQKQKELEIARKLQEQQQIKIQRDLALQEKLEKERIEKEMSRQQEKARLKGIHDQKLAERRERDEQIREDMEKAEVRKAANFYARGLQQQPIEYTVVQKNVPEFNSASVQRKETALNQSILSGNDDGLSERNRVVVNKDFLNNFRRRDDQAKTIVICPPQAHLRLFNEHDCLGEVERDLKGNVVVLEDSSGQPIDRNNKPTNQKGYLIDPASGDIVENMDFQVMFPVQDLDLKGELPAPFNLEKHNFNPHSISGDFDYRDGVPQVVQNSQGVYIDKQGRRVNQHGWYVTQSGSHIADNFDRKKFDRRQLIAKDDLPKLFNYEGRRFNIRDVMGEFTKDEHGNIQLHKAENGMKHVDLHGRPCNEKGYLTDKQGNIIDSQGRQLWKVTDLKSGEFMKIFPFSKFNVKNIMGDVQKSLQGEPVLDRKPNGTLVDKQGRLVNSRGYLIDKQGNVIDVHGHLVFDKVVLSPEGEIPNVFRSGVLHQDTDSSISRLMSEIERQAQTQSELAPANEDSTYDRQQRDGDDDTSVDSKMDDTPANYNLANQRYEFEMGGQRDSIPEQEFYADELDLNESNFTDGAVGYNPVVMIPRHKKGKKGKKNRTIEVLEPTLRQKNLAKAFGGEPKPEIRRPHVKYDKDRLKNSKKFRVTAAEEPLVIAQLTSLHKSGSQFESKPESKKQGQLMTHESTSGQPHKRSLNNAQEPDFEQVYGQDIDQFLEDSEWDIDQLDIDGQSSDDIAHKVTTDLKLREMERQFLGETPRTSGRKKMKSPLRKSESPSRPNESVKRIPKQRTVMGPSRETLLNVTSDPAVIHRGEILEFETRLK